jgi:membrane-bound lytic murein transglycosylase D
LFLRGLALSIILCAASARAQTAPSPKDEAPASAKDDNAGVSEPPRANEPQREDVADDPETQEEVDKSSEEMEAVRKAEEKAGLLPQAPGAGAHDALTVGLDPSDPLVRDVMIALGESLDGAPLADPAPAGSAASVSLPELLGISEEELRAKYDIPVELNDAVVAYIRFFQTDARDHFGRWLARSTRFLPMMQSTLQKEGLPLDLVYLSMIESGFNAYAYSFAKAAGLWQFMVGTSRRYGLITDFWVDERRDPAKSTLAAARYLKDLRQRFHGDWYLAWAGYNAGEGKVDKAIRKDGTKDFWMMMGKGRTLRAETKHYVPKLIAAALISKHPERFGFSVPYEQAEPLDEVRVPDSTDLHVIAKAAGLPFETVRDLNPELRRFCTPPGGWTVKLPEGTKETFLAAYEKLGPSDRLSFVEHKVEKGEPLSKIARAYGVSEAAIMRTNGIKSVRQIKVGKLLVIPMGGASRLAQGSQLEDKRAPKAQGRAAVPAVAKSTTPARAAVADGSSYVVKPGDSLWNIAAKFSTTVDKLKRLNNLTSGRAKALQVGQTIAIRD